MVENLPLQYFEKNKLSFLAYNIDIQNGHGVITKNIHYFYGNFPPARNYFVKDRF